MRALGSPPTIPSASIRNVVLPTVTRRPLNRPGTVGYGLFVRAWTMSLISASDRPSAESTGAGAVLMLTVPRLRAVSEVGEGGLVLVAKVQLRRDPLDLEQLVGVLEVPVAGAVGDRQLEVVVALGAIGPRGVVGVPPVLDRVDDRVALDLVHAERGQEPLHAVGRAPVDDSAAPPRR